MSMQKKETGHWTRPYVPYTPPKPVTPEKIQFQQNYADVVDLLQQKILNFIRLNERLRNNIINRKRFVDNTVDAITFNFMEFKEAYLSKFIDPDFEKYCAGFIELLRLLLLNFLKEIEYGGYAFKFDIRYQGKRFEKIISILNRDEEKTKD